MLRYLTRGWLNAFCTGDQVLNDAPMTLYFLSTRLLIANLAQRDAEAVTTADQKGTNREVEENAQQHKHFYTRDSL